MTSAKVSVVIVNWHSEDLLAATLTALDQQTIAPDRVVIVDNGSSKPLPTDRYSRGPIVVLPIGRNAGFAGGNNRAIQESADAEWLALLNPDAIPEPDWLRQLMAASRRYPDVSAFGSVQLDGTDASILDGLGDVYHVSGAAWRKGHGLPNGPRSAEPFEIFAPCAAAALYRRSTLVEAGGFDEDFFCYLEDVDLGFRLRLLGHKAMLVPTAIVRHLGGATSGGDQSDFAVYHGQRNLVWAYVKNMPQAYLWRYLPQHLLFNVASLLFFASRGQALTIMRAKWHALKGLPRMLGKRKAIQGSIRVSPEELRKSMAKGWLLPYLRRLH